MEYKIIKRIQNGQFTVGFQLTTRDKKIINIPKNQVVKAASQGLIVNAIYNKRTKSISGANGTDLRELPVIQYSKIEGFKIHNIQNKNKGKQTKVKCKSNHQLAREYIAKSKLMGKGEIEIELLHNDRVKLIEVLDKESTGTFIFPDFITDHDAYDGTGSLGDKLLGPFSGCKFTEIVINHDYLDWRGLFAGIKSEGTLSIKYLGKPVKHLALSFYYCLYIRKLNLNNLDTTNVIDMTKMFSDCIFIEELDLSRFNTSNVTSMHSMFNNCQSLKRLDLSSFDTHNVTNMGHLFYYCRALEHINIRSFDTSNVTNMDSMFDNCISLPKLDLSNFNTSKVTSMKAMFSGCGSPSKDLDLDLSSFDTSNVENMESMFEQSYLTKLDLSGFNTSKVKDMSGMFCTCQYLQQLNIRSFDTNQVTNMEIMFCKCKSL